jgi:hypothetical protein
MITQGPCPRRPSRTQRAPGYSAAIKKDFADPLIVTLTQHAATAASAAQQAAYLAAAHYGLATVPLANTYSWVISSVAFLLISMAMLKGVFSKRTAYVGIAAAIVGIAAGFYVFHPALATFGLPFALLTGVWSLMAGRRLYQLGKAQGAGEAAAVPTA